MKRVLFLFAALFFVAGCGGGNGDNAGPEPVVENPPENCISQYDVDDFTYWTSSDDPYLKPYPEVYVTEEFKNTVAYESLEKCVDDLNSVLPEEYELEIMEQTVNQPVHTNSVFFYVVESTVCPGNPQACYSRDVSFNPYIEIREDYVSHDVSNLLCHEIMHFAGFGDLYIYETGKATKYNNLPPEEQERWGNTESILMSVGYGLTPIDKIALRDYYGGDGLEWAKDAGIMDDRCE